MKGLIQKFSLKLVLLFVVSSFAYGQHMDEHGVYLSVEKMPTLEGGLGQIGKKIKYPKIAREMGIQGVVYVGFVVTSEGKISEPKILRSLAKPLDDEAMRLLNEDMKFTPGYHQGNPVPVRMVLPIRFRL